MAQSETPFEKQLARARFHSSFHRELEIAKALEIAQEDENIQDEAIGLELLGDIYHERGLEGKSLKMKVFERLDQLILATALYNSSLVRTTQLPIRKSELTKKLRRIEEDFLGLCGPTIDKNTFLYDVDRDYKQELEEFRQTCREKLISVQSQLAVFVSPLHDTDKESETRRALAVEELFLEIKAFMIKFITRIFDDCVEVLGPVPDDVRYAFVGFGSFARGEVTPYSDIESAVLIEEGKTSPSIKDYFVKLTEYFNFKVLNLQETIIPSMCIPSLNDNNEVIGSLKRHRCTQATCVNPEPDDFPTASRDETISTRDSTISSQAGTTAFPVDPTPLRDDDAATPRHNPTAPRNDPTVPRNEPRASPDDSFPRKPDWFYDNQMRGFSVDGRMSKACKTPLGCLVQGRGLAEDLIKTPTEMADLYAKSLLADRSSPDRKNNDYNLSTVLANVSFLYGNDETLVDTYDALVLSMTEGAEGVTKFNARQISAIKCLENALEVFQFSLNASDIGLISSVKKKLYRVVDMLVMNLGKFQYVSVVDNTPWNILKRFRDAGVMSREAFHNLMVIVGIVNEVRLTTYLRCGRQDELFSFFDQSVDIDYELAKEHFVRFFYTVFPFQRAVNGFLSRVRNGNSVDYVLFPSGEQFYEYSHLTSAIALSFTSYRFFNEVMGKFSEAFVIASDESSRRLCLAFLSCLHPDYSPQYCQKILQLNENESNENNYDWKIFSFLIASLASFHQDNIDNVEAFLQAATTEISRLPTSESPDSATKLIVQSYEILIRGLLKFRQKHYVEAMGDFDDARKKYVNSVQAKDRKMSLFVTCCVFMKGRCHLELGNYDDSCIETAMRSARDYTGNGQYMRILYHGYIGVVCVDGVNQDHIVSKHCEKALELFLRFQCPKGQEPWASIPAQGIILAALFLGIFYREMDNKEDALRIFRLSSARLIPKASEFCTKEYHVGRESADTARMYIGAFQAIFKLLEAECLHASDRHEEMWTCLAEALAHLAKYRGKFQPIELRDVLSATASRQSTQPRENEGPAVYQTRTDPVAPAPRLIDTFTMAPLLETWCDSLTMAMQYILFTMERDIYGELLEKGSSLILLLALMFQNPTLLDQFKSNPYQILKNFIPFLRNDATAAQMVGEIFRVANSQRRSGFELLKNNIVECQHFAAEFTDEWIELLLLYLRLSLCHDLVSASGVLK